MFMHNAGRKCIYIFIYLPPPGCSPPPFLSNSSIPLCPLLSLFSPLCHFSLEALVLTSSSALTSAFSLPPFFQTLFGLFLFFLSFLPLPLNLHLYFSALPAPFVYGQQYRSYTQRSIFSLLFFFVCSSFLTPSV